MIVEVGRIPMLAVRGQALIAKNLVAWCGRTDPLLSSPFQGEGPDATALFIRRPARPGECRKCNCERVTRRSVIGRLPCCAEACHASSDPLSVHDHGQRST